MKTYSADEIIGKTLYIKSGTRNIRRSASTSGEVVRKVSKGMSAGVVYSWLNQPDGLWWRLDTPVNNPEWIKHETGAFDLELLKYQGAKTTQEKFREAQNANKTTGDKIVELLKKGGKVLAFLGVGVLAYKYFNKKQKQ